MTSNGPPNSSGADVGQSLPETIAPETEQNTHSMNRPAEHAAGDGVAIGSLLGPYRLVELLGRGGMGSVYKAEHGHLAKCVALKVLPASMMRDPAAVNRFKREMRAVGKLDHPHIVQAFDAGEVGGVHYLAMELIEGVDLSKWVKTHGPMTPLQAATAIRQAALGLAAAHEVKLYHRDIKPSNLLLTKGGQIKILDLGLARLAEEATEPSTELTGYGEAMGTPDFMAPEQWSDSHSADGRSDLYALGCTLYFLLTGRAPYESGSCRTLVNKMNAHLTAPPPELETTAPDLPGPLVEIYRKLLAKAPRDRYQSAAELADLLGEFVSTAPEGTRGAMPLRTTDLPAPASAAGKVPSVPKRSGWLVLAGGLVAAAVACGIIVTIRHRDGTETRVEVPSTSEVVVTGPDGVITKVPPADGSSPLPPRPQGMPDAAATRSLAEFALTRGGTIVIEPDWRTITKAAELPQTPFVLRDILFDHSHLPLTPEDFERISRHPHLRNLSAVTNGDLKAIAAHLAKLPRLQLLGLTNVDQNLAPLAAVGRNRSLVYFSTTTGDIRGDWSFLDNLPTVRTLKFWSGEAAHLAGFGSHPQLRTLVYHGEDLSDAVAENLQKGNPQLRIIAIGTAGTRRAGRDPLRESLQRLHRRGFQLTVGRYGLPLTETLTDSMLADGEGWQVGQVTCGASVNATPEEAGQIAALTDAEYISLAFADVLQADGLAREFGRIARIWNLSLARSDLSDAGLRSLEGVIDLRNLNIKGTKVTEAGIAHFRQAHPTCFVESNFGDLMPDSRAPIESPAEIAEAGKKP